MLVFQGLQIKISLTLYEYNWRILWKLKFSSIRKTIKFVKKNGHTFKKKDIDDFLLKQKEHELLKVKQVKKKQIGHITAFTYKENGQMDIYDISKYSKTNKNYKYLLVLMDVSSKYPWNPTFNRFGLTGAISFFWNFYFLKPKIHISKMVFSKF